MINGLMESCFPIYHELKPQNNRTEVICSFSSHGYEFLCRETTGNAMFDRLHVFVSYVSFVLLLSHLIFFLLVKLFGYLHIRAAFRDQKYAIYVLYIYICIIIFFISKVICIDSANFVVLMVF